jgi:hypothetical protein
MIDVTEAEQQRWSSGSKGGPKVKNMGKLGLDEAVLRAAVKRRVGKIQTTSR